MNELKVWLELQNNDCNSAYVYNQNSQGNYYY